MAMESRLRGVIMLLLAVAIAAFAAATVVEFYDECVQEDCVGPNCVTAYSYQKTWTKVWYDDVLHKVVGHAGNHDIRSGGIRHFEIASHEHPYVADCIADPKTTYGWIRVDYDHVYWYDAGIFIADWYTESTVRVVDACRG